MTNIELFNRLTNDRDLLINMLVLALRSELFVLPTIDQMDRGKKLILIDMAEAILNGESWE